MKTDIKKIILRLGILAVLLFVTVSIYAASNNLQVIYPSINGSSLNVTSTFPHYIAYLYKFLLWVSGIIVVLILIISGISYTASAGDPVKTKNAKKGITAGIIGLVIIFSAFLILYVINPQLTSVKLTSVQSPIRLIGTATSIQTNETKTISVPIRDSFSNTDALAIPYGYNNFQPTKLCCSSTISHLKEIDIFPTKDFQGDTTTITNCNNVCYSKVIASGKFSWTTSTNEGGLEAKYPAIGNSSPLQNSSTLADFISYWYKLIIWIAGLITILILLKGAVAYISSTGNPAKMNDARSIIFSALVGLGVILGSYLILSTINPELGAPKIQSSPNLGIWLEDAQGNKLPVNNDIPQVSSNFIYPEKICFPASNNSLVSKQINNIILLPEKNFEGQGTYLSVFTPGCQDISGMIVKSIKIDWDLPGLYIDIYNNASTVIPFYIRTSQANLKKTLGEFYNKQWKAIQMKDATNTAYSAIFYINTDFLPPTDEEKSNLGQGEGVWIYPGLEYKVNNTIFTTITFPHGYYTLPGSQNYHKLYTYPPHFGSVQIINKDLDGMNNVNVWLYKAGNYMEKDEGGNDLTCPNFCPHNGAMLFPWDLSPQRFNILPHKRGCANDVESLRTRGLAILIEPPFTPGPTDPYPWSQNELSYPSPNAEAFFSDQPDLSKKPIGQCGSKTWRHMFRYIPQPCAQYIMLLPIKY